MKSKIIFFAVLVMALTFPHVACAYDFSAVSPSGHTLYYKILNDSCVEVTAPCQSSPCYGFNNSELSGRVIIPSSVNIDGAQYVVTQLGNIAFYGCTNMTEVVIPTSVKSIVSAFAGCTGLTKTTYLGTLEQWLQIKMSGSYYPPQYYSHNLYVNGELLTDLIIPEGVTAIPSQSFTGCTSINTVQFPSTLISIGEMAFEECSGLQSVTIPPSVRAIRNRAFAYCNNLTSVEFEGDKIDTLAGGLFILSRITNITLPDTVISMGTVVSRCSYLTSLTLPSTISSIPTYFTMGCSNLSQIICRRPVAPTVNANSFYNVPATASILVPCGSINSYSSSWSVFSDFRETFPYAFSASSEGLGHVEIIPPTCESDAIAYAIADDGNRFEMWSDGITANPRTFVLTSDSSIHAIFVDNHVEFNISPNNPSMGNTVGAGNYIRNTLVTLYALPKPGFSFQGWSNGELNNPYDLQADQDTALIAIFSPKDTITLIEYIPVHDTTLVRDTTYLPVYLHDTSYVEIHDTTTVWDTTYIDVPYAVHDTTTITDTMTLTEYVPVHDTTYVPIHDTAYIDNWLHDTTYINIHDTTYITLTDTVTLTQYDTVTNTVFDTIDNYIHDTLIVTDTLWLTQTDTLWLHDTIVVHDTVYITQEGVGEVDAMNAKVYSNRGQIVVEGADGNMVTLFDVNGRVLVTKRDEYMPLRFEAPASGTYMIKIGSHPARKVVVIR